MTAASTPATIRLVNEPLSQATSGPTTRPMAPKPLAKDRETRPEGIGRPGRSCRSISASNTSFRAMPAA